MSVGIALGFGRVQFSGVDQSSQDPNEYFVGVLRDKVHSIKHGLKLDVRLAIRPDVWRKASELKIRGKNLVRKRMGDLRRRKTYTMITHGYFQPNFWKLCLDTSTNLTSQFNHPCYDQTEAGRGQVNTA